MDRIRQLAQKYGVKLAKRAARKGYVFDGKTIALYDYNTVARYDTHVIHDIAHYVVASRRRRKLPEFGLGSSPDITRFRGKLVVSPKFAQKEEALASALGIYWEREFGMDWKSTFEDHYWTEDIDIKTPEEEIFNLQKKHKFARGLQELRRRKII